MLDGFLCRGIRLWFYMVFKVFHILAIKIKIDLNDFESSAAGEVAVQHCVWHLLKKRGTQTELGPLGKSWNIDQHWPQKSSNVGKYIIHGAYGYYWITMIFRLRLPQGTQGTLKIRIWTSRSPCVMWCANYFDVPKRCQREFMHGHNIGSKLLCEAKSSGLSACQASGGSSSVILGGAVSLFLDELYITTSLRPCWNDGCKGSTDPKTGDFPGKWWSVNYSNLSPWFIGLIPIFPICISTYVYTLVNYSLTVPSCMNDGDSPRENPPIKICWMTITYHQLMLSHG